MLNLLISILGIIITILLVVGIHEFGHFIVARMCGIKVLRFSIGFGKALKTWHDKSGTEYVLAVIPLGGYVKMLDESEDTVKPEELHLAYGRQPIYKRMAVIIAGPLTNILFSIFLYWLLFIIGFTTIKPIIGNILPESIAAKAGMKPQQELVQVDHQAIHSWYSAMIKMILRSGEHGQLQLQTQTLKTNQKNDYTLELATWKMDGLRPDPLKSLGIVPYEPIIPSVIATVKENSPAAKSNLKAGDKIIAVDDHKISDWISLFEIINKSPEKKLNFTVLRQGKKIILPVTLGSQRDLFMKKYGYLGVAPDFKWDPQLLRQNKLGPLDAIPQALQQAKDFTVLNLIVFGKMITGKISLQSLGGPITIFETAGNALNQGLTPFISFLAFLSISIGIINIFPIPGLDGGHLLFQIIELITRRPISLRVQTLFYRFGLILLLVFIIQALANDIVRLVS